MIKLIAQRMFSLFASLVLASLVIFFLLEIIPGDPAQFMLGLNASPEAVANLKQQLGLNEPILLRYFSWITGFFTGDLGISYTYRVPVSSLIADRLQVSLPLAIYALCLTVVIAIPLGILAASKQKSITDGLVMSGTQLGIAIPNFWFAMMLVLCFSVWLRWFSSGGFEGWEQGTLLGLKSLTLPAIALALPQASILTRIMRSSLLDTLGEDYIRTARSKGLSARKALIHHALRNALIPVITIIGMQFSVLLAGAIIIENVFFLPGIGRLVFQAVSSRDLIVVRSVVMLLVFAVIFVNFMVELMYGLIDPRVRAARNA